MLVIAHQTLAVVNSYIAVLFTNIPTGISWTSPPETKDQVIRPAEIVPER